MVLCVAEIHNKCTYFTVVVCYTHSIFVSYHMWRMIFALILRHSAHTFGDSKMCDTHTPHAQTHMLVWYVLCYVWSTTTMTTTRETKLNDVHVYATYVYLGSNICVLFLFICDNGHNVRYRDKTKLKKNMNRFRKINTYFQLLLNFHYKFTRDHIKKKES